jgi:zinc protease
MVLAAMPRMQWGTVDGVQALWMESAGGFTAGVSFRVGPADEPLPSRGLTHLAEHLALEELGRERLHGSTILTPLFTSIHASGDEEEASDFIQHALRGLARLNAGRLGTEAKAVEAEGAGRPLGMEENLLWRRFGYTGLGRAAAPELATRLADPHEVVQWTSMRFTRQSAVFWFAGQPPRWLEMPLSEGSWAAAPQSATIPWLPLPGSGTFQGDGVGLSMVLPSTPAAERAAHVLLRRAEVLLPRGLARSVRLSTQPIGLDSDHVSLIVDCHGQFVPEVAGSLVGMVDLLSRQAPSLIEFREWLATSEERLQAPDAVAEVVRGQALRLLLGGEPQDIGTWLDARRTVHPAEPMALVREAVGSVIVLTPKDVAWSDPRLNPIVEGSGEGIEGRRMTRVRPESQGVDCILGVDAISEVSGKWGRARVVRYASCVAMVLKADGSRTLLDRDGTMLRIDPADWKEGEMITTLLDHSIPHDRWIHLTGTEMLLPPLGE